MNVGAAAEARDLSVYFEIYQQGSATGGSTDTEGTGGAWQWRLKSADDEIIASGENYSDHADCLRAVRLVRGTSCTTPIKDVR
jgi:uncharacterized protein YegP (UPF0339 family)